MKIGIFSKFDMDGGSERRCVELARGISKYSDHESIILCEKSMPQKLLAIGGFNYVEKIFENQEEFFSCDAIVVVNTDSKEFTTTDYWFGKSHRHDKVIDLSLFSGKKMAFLFNFLISPSRYLADFENYGIDVSILTANKKFYEEVTKQDRYENVRHFPRFQINSPIDPSSVEKFERSLNSSGTMNLGFHSKGAGNKWNGEIGKLAKKCNDRYGQSVHFHFMGMNGTLRRELEKSSPPNITLYKENEIPVKDFLSNLHVFTFFPDFKREEPWCRVIAEAMVSGLPVIATNKGGNKDQVLHCNNGYLCGSTDDFFKRIVYLKENPHMVNKMSKNSLVLSKTFVTEEVIKKLVRVLS